MIDSLVGISAERVGMTPMMRAQEKRRKTQQVWTATHNICSIT